MPEVVSTPPTTSSGSTNWARWRGSTARTPAMDGLRSPGLAMCRLKDSLKSNRRMTQPFQLFIGCSSSTGMSAPVTGSTAAVSEGTTTYTCSWCRETRSVRSVPRMVNTSTGSSVSTSGSCQCWPSLALRTLTLRSGWRTGMSRISVTARPALSACMVRKAAGSPSKSRRQRTSVCTFPSLSSGCEGRRRTTRWRSVSSCRRGWSSRCATPTL